MFSCKCIGDCLLIVDPWLMHYSMAHYHMAIMLATHLTAVPQLSELTVSQQTQPSPAGEGETQMSMWHSDQIHSDMLSYMYTFMAVCCLLAGPPSPPSAISDHPSFPPPSPPSTTSDHPSSPPLSLEPALGQSTTSSCPHLPPQAHTGNMVATHLLIQRCIHNTRRKLSIVRRVWVSVTHIYWMVVMHTRILVRAIFCH